MRSEADFAAGGDEVQAIPLRLGVAVEERRLGLEWQAEVRGGSADFHAARQPDAKKNDANDPLAHEFRPQEGV